MKHILISLFMILSVLQVNAQVSPIEAKPLETKPDHDQYILEKGEVSKSRHVIGAILSVVPGFGVGHVVNKQFGRSGWIFLAGEGAGVAIMAAGAAGCLGNSVFEPHKDCNNAMVDIGAATFLGFKVWEVVDAITRPSKHNARLRELEANKPAASAVYLVPRFDTIGANLVYSF